MTRWRQANQEQIASYRQLAFSTSAILKIARALASGLEFYPSTPRARPFPLLPPDADVRHNAFADYWCEIELQEFVVDLRRERPVDGRAILAVGGPQDVEVIEHELAVGDDIEEALPVLSWPATMLTLLVFSHQATESLRDSSR